MFMQKSKKYDDYKQMKTLKKKSEAYMFMI